MQTNAIELNSGLYRDENKLLVGEWIMVIYMFVISTNLFNQFFLLSTGLFIFAALYYVLDIKFTKSLLVLLMFAVSDMIGCMVGGSVMITNLMRPFYFVLFFLLGKNISKDGNRKMSLYIMLAMAFGAAAHGVANFIMNYMEFGMNPRFRNLPDIWVRDGLAATGQGALFAPFVGTLFYGVFCTKKIMSKILFLAVLVCLCLYNMMTASRTVFVLIVIVVLTCFIIHMIQRGGDAKIFIWFLGIICVALVAYAVNLFGVREFLEDTAFTKRMDSIDGGFLDSGRIDIMKYYIAHMYQSPFGGRFIKNGYILGKHAHNMFLDVYDMAGFLGLFFLLWFCVIVFKKTVKFIKIKWVDIPFKILAFGMMLSMFLQSMTEPVLEGMPWMFAMFCTVVGVIDGICTYSDNVENNEM